MAKKKVHHRGGGFKLPIALMAGIGAGLAGPVDNMLGGGSIKDTLNILSKNYTGYDYIAKSWSLESLKQGLGPLVFGALIHKFVGGTLGVNRMLARAKVPFIRL